MKITELIEHLELACERHGDVEVKILESTCYDNESALRAYSVDYRVDTEDVVIRSDLDECPF